MNNYNNQAKADHLFCILKEVDDFFNKPISKTSLANMKAERIDCLKKALVVYRMPGKVSEKAQGLLEKAICKLMNSIVSLVEFQSRTVEPIGFPTRAAEEIAQAMKE